MNNDPSDDELKEEIERYDAIEIIQGVFTNIKKLYTPLRIFAGLWSLVEQQSTVVLDYEMQPVRHTHIGTFHSHAAHYSASKVKVDIASHVSHRGLSRLNKQIHGTTSTYIRLDE